MIVSRRSHLLAHTSAPIMRGAAVANAKEQSRQASAEAMKVASARMKALLANAGLPDESVGVVTG